MTEEGDWWHSARNATNHQELLVPAMVVMIISGRFILGLFGVSYAFGGDELLILLAIAGLPDAVSNIAVGGLRSSSTAGVLESTKSRRPGDGSRMSLVLHAIARNTGVARCLARIIDLEGYRKPAYVQLLKTSDLECAGGRNAINPGIVQLIELAKLRCLDTAQRPKTLSSSVDSLW